MFGIIEVVSKKKRNKQYKGSAPVRPTITKVSAVKRNPVHQWWIDHERYVKPALPVIGVIVVIIIAVLGLVSLIWLK